MLANVSSLVFLKNNNNNKMKHDSMDSLINLKNTTNSSCIFCVIFNTRNGC